MRAEKDPRRRLRRAYREAWTDRATAGNGDEVLRARLRAHQLDEVLDETTPLHRVVFDFWRRDVPPHRIGLEALRLLGRSAVRTAAAHRYLWRTIFHEESGEERVRAEQADLMDEMPEDRAGVLDNVDRPGSASLDLEPAESAGPVLRRYAELDRGLGGRHQVSVWFEMLPDRPRASVLLGSVVIGEAAVPAEIWRAMRSAAGVGLYADGFLDFRVRNDAVQTGELLCYYAPPPPPRPARPA